MDVLITTKHAEDEGDFPFYFDIGLTLSRAEVCLLIDDLYSLLDSKSEMESSSPRLNQVLIIQALEGRTFAEQETAVFQGGSMDFYLEEDKNEYPKSDPEILGEFFKRGNRG